MKKILCVLTLLAALICMACFNSDPNSMLKNTGHTIVTGGGGSVVIIGPPGKKPESDLAISAAIDASFPFTVNTSFTGFVNDDGTADTDVVQLIIFYYDKTGGWQVLKEINNPRYTVVSDAARALFGRHTVTGPLGYLPGEFIPVVFYFRSSSGTEAFDLSLFLKKKKNLYAPNLVEGAAVLALNVVDNRVAY